MKKNIIKAEEQMVYMIRDIEDMKEELSDAIEDKNEDHIESSLRQLRARRSNYRGMVRMYSILTGEHEADIKERMKELAK